jgi:uncharacterized protein YndB with AHSA1/START domain
VRLDVAIEEVLPQPVEEVWGALTDPGAISDWLMATSDFEPRVGATFRMKTGRLAADGWVRVEVLELDAPGRMVWAWLVDAAAPTTVTFELTPVAEGTRLRLTHVGDIDPTIGGLLAEGWPTRIELLRRSL